MLMRSKSSTSTLIAALTLSTIFVAIVFALSPAVAKAQKGGSMQSDASTPIPGIGVTVKKYKPRESARTTQTDAEGNFTVDGLAPGLYDIRLACDKCASMDIGEAGVLLTLTGTTKGEFKKTISKRELVSGVEFSIEIARRDETRKLLSGHVSLIK
jgi:hypothetical protein